MLTRPVLQRRQPRGDDLVAVPSRLASLGAQQDGVLTRAQLHSAGVTRSAVDAAVAASRWRTFGRRVVVLGNAALTDRQREWVAVLSVDKPVALAGETAAAAAGLTGFRADRVHVVVPHATHVALPTWVKIHESRRFGVDDIRPGRPPRTGPAWSVLDAATWSPRPRRACALLCAGVQQRIVSVPGLEVELERAGRVRHAAIMRAILGDIGGGGHTLAEIDLGRIAGRAGLPAPRRQVLRREPDGKVRYLDAEFDLPDGRQLVVEVDGAVHLRPVSYWDDMDRQNEIVIGGRPVLRFASLTVRLDEKRVADQLRRIWQAHSPAAPAQQSAPRPA